MFLDFGPRRFLSLFERCCSPGRVTFYLDWLFRVLSTPFSVKSISLSRKFFRIAKALVSLATFICERPIASVLR
jgi:hypothetical protein